MSKLTPCPYTGASTCGNHKGACQQCNRLSVKDRFMITLLALMLIAALFLTSCSAHYCPTYGGHSYNKSGGKAANTSVKANRKR